MDRDFFVKLVFGTHRVAEFLPQKDKVKSLANRVLSDLLLFAESNPVTIEQKINILPRTLREIEMLKALLNAEKSKSAIDPKAFLILDKEYQKIPNMLITFLEKSKTEAEGTQRNETKEQLSIRQKKIVEFLKTKEKVQVWELKKIMPEVTKRTLRRDIDALLHLNLIERQGEWNAVFYIIKK